MRRTAIQLLLLMMLGTPLAQANPISLFTAWQAARQQDPNL